MEEITVYYATPWQLLAAAAPYAIKSVGQLLGVGKPKKEDYMPDTSYMDKYIANIRSRQAGRDVYHQAMQPALRTIGQQGRKMQRQVGYGVEKAGLTGSGIEAQQRLSAGKATLGAMQEASEKATAAQISESRRLGTEADRMTMQKEGAIAQGEKAYDRAQTAFKQDALGNIVSGVGAVAGAGIQQKLDIQNLGKEIEREKLSGILSGKYSETIKNDAVKAFMEQYGGAKAISKITETTSAGGGLPPHVSGYQVPKDPSSGDEAVGGGSDTSLWKRFLELWKSGEGEEYYQGYE